MTLKQQSILCIGCHGHLNELGLDPLPVPVSPVPELLRNLRLPSTSQESAIQKTILEWQQNLANMDAKIARLTTTLDELRQNRTAIDRYVKDHESIILSPIRRLPVEILGEIFATYTKDEYAPWLLMRVCIGWRDVALATPKVWATIVLNMSQRDNFSSEYIGGVTTWIARSRSHPLTIKIDDTRSRESHPIAELLVVCSDRWQHLSLNTRDLRHFQTTENSLASLQSLSCRIAHEMHEVYNLTRARRLRCLHVYGRLSSDNFSLDWHQLRDIHLHGIDAGACLQFLSQCPNLFYVDIIQGGTPSSASAHLGPQISLQSVKILQLKLPLSSAGLIDCLTLPNLRDLRLMRLGRRDQFESADICPSLTALMRRSNCSLEQLILPLSPSDDYLEKFLQSIPLLANLEFTGYSGLSEFALQQLISAKNPTRDSGPLLPRLKSLTIRYFNKSHFHQESFLNMIESRWLGAESLNSSLTTPVVCLQKVHVTFYDDYGIEVESMRPRLGKLHAQGMDLSIHDSPGIHAL